MSIKNLLLHPQIRAFLPLMITFSLLCRYKDKKPHRYWLFGCPAAMIFWVYVHESFILGPEQMGISLVSSTFDFLITPKKTQQKSKIYWLVGLTGPPTMAVLINPRFISICSCVAELLTDPTSQKSNRGMVITYPKWNSEYYISYQH